MAEILASKDIVLRKSVMVFRSFPGIFHGGTLISALHDDQRDRFLKGTNAEVDSKIRSSLFSLRLLDPSRPFQS
ncbi:MAG TPA: hypothetical protein VIJ89_01600 [Deferrimonas sp.]